jgi:thiol-disulfide isomerase/thioredoxin
LLTFALAGVGCGQQDEIHTNTGPESNASAATPATAPAATTEVSTVTTVPAGVPDSPPVPPAAKHEPETTLEKVGSDVTLEKVSYDAFLQRVASNPSKPRYTIVDVWASWCGPCKENFPHVIEMHRKYADKGLAVASLSFDDPAKTSDVESAKAFLREKKATMTNYLLDEGEGVGFEKFGVNSIPAVFLYGPDGKEVKRFTWDDPNNQFTYDQVEKTVAELLEGKSS